MIRQSLNLPQIATLLVKHDLIETALAAQARTRRPIQPRGTSCGRFGQRLFVQRTIRAISQSASRFSVATFGSCASSRWVRQSRQASRSALAPLTTHLLPPVTLVRCPIIGPSAGDGMPQSWAEKQDRLARKRRDRVLVWGGLAAVASLVTATLVLLQEVLVLQ